MNSPYENLASTPSVYQLPSFYCQTSSFLSNIFATFFVSTIFEPLTSGIIYLKKFPTKSYPQFATLYLFFGSSHSEEEREDSEPVEF
jgi:hypothetical protein